MSDHSDISYISDDEDQFTQQQRGGPAPAQQGFRGRRPARISHASSLGSSAVGEDLQDAAAAATSWQVGCSQVISVLYGSCHDVTALVESPEWVCCAVVIRQQLAWLHSTRHLCSLRGSQQMPAYVASSIKWTMQCNMLAHCVTHIYCLPHCILAGG